MLMGRVVWCLCGAIRTPSLCTRDAAKPGPIVPDFPETRRRRGLREDIRGKGCCLPENGNSRLVSFDDGDHGSRCNQSARPTWTDCEVARKGSGCRKLLARMWVVDDISTLRELSAKVFGSPYFFQAQPAMRVRRIKQ